MWSTVLSIAGLFLSGVVFHECSTPPRTAHTPASTPKELTDEELGKKKGLGRFVSLLIGISNVVK
jgi:hypothetical protein